MSTIKIVVSVDRKILKALDQLVKRKVFTNRSRAVNQALEEKIARLDRGRLARECNKLDPKAEQALADEGLAGEL